MESSGKDKNLQRGQVAIGASALAPGNNGYANPGK